MSTLFLQDNIPGCRCITRAVALTGTTGVMQLEEAYREVMSLMTEALLHHFLTNNILVLPIEMHQELSIEQKQQASWLRMDVWVPEKVDLANVMLEA